MTYIELQTTSNYSFLRGASHVEELLAQAKLFEYDAIAITDRNSLAGIARAHQRADEAGMRLIIGCRLDLDCGTSVLAYPTDRAAYARLCRMLSIGKGRAGKGACRLEWSDLAAHGEGLIAILLSDAADPGAARKSCASACGFRRPRLSRVDPAAPPGRRRAAARAGTDGAGSPRAHGRYQRCAVPRSTPARAAGCGHLHTRGLHDRRCGFPPQPFGRAAPEDVRRDGAAVFRLSRSRCAHQADCRTLPVQPARIMLPVPARDRSWRERAGAAGAADPGGCDRALRLRAGESRHADHARAGTHRGDAICTVFPDGVQHRQFRQVTRDIVPGPRQCCELCRVLRARHHRDRSGAEQSAVRAVPQQRASRAAGHRRGFRARAARGGDTVDLRDIRARPRGPVRHRCALPFARRGPRSW